MGLKSGLCEDNSSHSNLGCIYRVFSLWNSKSFSILMPQCWNHTVDYNIIVCYNFPLFSTKWPIKVVHKKQIQTSIPPAPNKKAVCALMYHWKLHHEVPHKQFLWCCFLLWWCTEYHHGVKYNKYRKKPKSIKDRSLIEHMKFLCKTQYFPNNWGFLSICWCWYLQYV